jgi:hypothetical protein
MRTVGKYIMWASAIPIVATMFFGTWLIMMMFYGEPTKDAGIFTFLVLGTLVKPVALAPIPFVVGLVVWCTGYITGERRPPFTVDRTNGLGQ